jgi:hypothetical protein
MEEKEIWEIPELTNHLIGLREARVRFGKKIRKEKQRQRHHDTHFYHYAFLWGSVEDPKLSVYASVCVPSLIGVIMIQCIQQTKSPLPSQDGCTHPTYHPNLCYFMVGGLRADACL